MVPVLSFSGSEAGIVKVWNILGNEPISRFRNTSSARPSFRDGSVHPVVSMHFHPHEMVLGVGGTDAKLNVSLLRRGSNVRQMLTGLYNPDIPLSVLINSQ